MSQARKERRAAEKAARKAKQKADKQQDPPNPWSFMDFLRSPKGKVTAAAAGLATAGLGAYLITREPAREQQVVVPDKIEWQVISEPGKQGVTTNLNRTYFLLGDHVSLGMADAVDHALTQAEKEGDPFKLVIHEAATRDSKEYWQKYKAYYSDKKAFDKDVRVLARQWRMDEKEMKRVLYKLARTAVGVAAGELESFDSLWSEYRKMNVPEGLTRLLMSKSAGRVTHYRSMVANGENDFYGITVVNVFWAHDVDFDFCEKPTTPGYAEAVASTRKNLESAGYIDGIGSRGFMPGKPFKTLLEEISNDRVMKDDNRRMRDKIAITEIPETIRKAGKDGEPVKTLVVYGVAHKGVATHAGSSWSDHQVSITEIPGKKYEVTDKDPAHVFLLTKVMDTASLLTSTETKEDVFGKFNKDDMVQKIRSLTQEQIDAMGTQLDKTEGITRVITAMSMLTGRENIQVNLNQEQVTRDIAPHIQAHQELRQYMPNNILEQIPE